MLPAGEQDNQKKDATEGKKTKQGKASLENGKDRQSGGNKESVIG